MSEVKFEISENAVAILSTGTGVDVLEALSNKSFPVYLTFGEGAEWIICNGQKIPREGYPELYSVLRPADDLDGVTLPDMTGMLDGEDHKPEKIAIGYRTIFYAIAPKLLVTKMGTIFPGTVVAFIGKISE